jgi:hypothetical protein
VSLHRVANMPYAPGEVCLECGMIAVASSLCENGVDWPAACPGKTVPVGEDTLVYCALCACHYLGGCRTAGHAASERRVKT